MMIVIVAFAVMMIGIARMPAISVVTIASVVFRTSLRSVVMTMMLAIVAAL